MPRVPLNLLVLLSFLRPRNGYSFLPYEFLVASPEFLALSLSYLFLYYIIYFTRLIYIGDSLVGRPLLRYLLVSPSSRLSIALQSPTCHSKILSLTSQSTNHCSQSSLNSCIPLIFLSPSDFGTFPPTSRDLSFILPDSSISGTPRS